MLLRLLALLPLAIAGAQLDPTTATITAVTTALVNGVSGNLLSDALVTGEKTLLSAVFKRRKRVPQSNPIFAALAQAHIDALSDIAARFDKLIASVPADTNRDTVAFGEAIKAFLGKAPTAELTGFNEASVFNALPGLSNQLAAIEFSARYDAREINREVLGMLADAMGWNQREVPIEFRSLFEETASGWFGKFVEKATEALITNDEFQKLWLVWQNNLVLERIVSFARSVHTKLDAILVNLEQSVPIEFIEALLAGTTGRTGQPASRAEILQQLADISSEVQQLRRRLAETERPISRIVDLKSKAADRLSAGEFKLADVLLAQAEDIDELSAAHTRFDRGVAARLARNPEALAQAIEHFRRAQEMAIGIDPSLARECGRQQARTLIQLGTSHLDKKHTLQAIDILTELSNTSKSESDWAKTATELAGAYYALGERRNSNDDLQVAQGILDQILGTFNGSGEPLVEATTHHYRGRVLLSLGERCGDERMLYEAIDAFQQAVAIRRGRADLDAARSLNNIGITQHRLGERKVSPKLLDAAKTYYADAQSLRSRWTQPVEWAETQNNLANTIAEIAERGEQEEPLRQAIQMLDEVLRLRDPWTEPAGWAETQLNKGMILSSLAALSQDHKVELVLDAEECFRSAERVLGDSPSLETFPLLRDSQGRAKLICAKTASDFEEAIRLLKIALSAWNAKSHPLERAVTQVNLGEAQARFAKQTRNRDRHRKALSQMRAAIDDLSTTGHDWYIERAKRQLRDVEKI